MDRRGFVESCGAGMACLSAGLALPAMSGELRARSYERVVLCDEFGDPVRVASLKPLTNYVFHYPFVATPVFLLDLGQAVAPQSLRTRSGDSYQWPGGVGPARNLVAYSAICAHRLVYPTPQVSFISFRKKRASKGVADKLIHCCSENSQYDPAQGARVMNGPADQPLCAVLLDYDAGSDTLTAHGTLGGELFDAFFEKYAFKLSLDVGSRAHQAVSGKSTVRELAKFCRNPIQC